MGDQHAHQPAETRSAEDADANADLGEGTSNPAPDESSESNLAPSVKKPKLRSGFVEIIELGEEDMLMG